MSRWRPSRRRPQHGRAGLFDLFRILGTAETETLRHAAGHALTVLWAQDQLIAEEEQAVVRRGYSVSWHARRRYPRALRSAIPIAVSYGLPFLREDGAGITPANLEWSHRILGAERAGLEAFTPWTPGPGRAEFTINPGDFAANGPHRIEIQARVRTVGLTSSWEIALPHIPFSFELDPILQPEALLSLADASREERMARAVRLEPASPGDRVDVGISEPERRPGAARSAPARRDDPLAERPGPYRGGRIRGRAGTVRGGGRSS